MGGSSGGGGTGITFGGLGGPKASDPCNIRTTTTLQGTKPTVLKNLNEGDELEVALHPNSSSRTVGCLNPDSGALVGTITIASQATLINCLLDGAIYSAKVMLIESGRCDVRIRRRS